MAKLVLSLNGNVLNQYFTDKPELKIGRDAGNDIAINDALLSREHARILSVGEDHIVEDMQSSNGTLVNGAPVTRKILQHRDVIGLGSHSLRYLNTRMSSDVDLERTMLIKSLTPDNLPEGEMPAAAVTTARTVSSWLPPCSVRIISCSNGQHDPDSRVPLDRVVSIFGDPGERLVVITRRPNGYTVTHVEGPQVPRVNRKPIGNEACPLRAGDEIEAAGYRLEFLPASS